MAKLLVALLVATAVPLHAYTGEVPPSGLPSAADYSAQILPELEGTVSWRTLAAVEPVKENGKMVPRFSREILNLHTKDVRVVGFVVPLDMGKNQRHFLISAVPMHCQFCMPAGPEAMVEVIAKDPVTFTFEPVVMAGKLAVLKTDPNGLLYRLTGAIRIATKPVSMR